MKQSYIPKNFGAAKTDKMTPNDHQRIEDMAKRIRSHKWTSDYKDGMSQLTTITARNLELEDVVRELLSMTKPMRDQILSRTNFTVAFDRAYQQINPK